MKVYYTVTGYDGSDCGHTHPTRESALPCRTRTRLTVQRVEVPDPPRWWERALAWGVFLGGLGALVWYWFS